ncbi:IS1 family transposase, partial [Klebsiella pneumoniae]
SVHHIWCPLSSQEYQDLPDGAETTLTHNLNLRQHLARLGRKSLSFSKSVALHDKVIGHYLNIKHYQ